MGWQRSRWEFRGKVGRLLTAPPELIGLRLGNNIRRSFSALSRQDIPWNACMHDVENEHTIACSCNGD